MKLSKIMNAKEYLKALEECPDVYKLIGKRNTHLLLADFLVADNFAIYLNLDYKKSVEFMGSLSDFELGKETESGDMNNKKFYSFLYSPGTVNGNIIEWIHVPPEFIVEELKSKYQSTIMLHTYQGKHIAGKLAENMSEERVLANCLIKIGNELIKQSVEFCFASSRQLDAKDIGELVYYP
ncbi:MAG: hypothetical protein ACP5N2_02975 [Candidatus Nanoarchaeia archaeon]